MNKLWYNQSQKNIPRFQILCMIGKARWAHLTNHHMRRGLDAVTIVEMYAGMAPSQYTFLSIRHSRSIKIVSFNAKANFWQ